MPARLVAILLALALLAGCSGGHPLAPTADPSPSVTAITPGMSPPGQTLLGGYGLTLSREDDLKAELSPLRTTSAIGDTFNEVGLTGTMDGGLCDCFRVKSLELIDPTTVRATFHIVHPFQSTLRPDLDAFNLKAHIAADQNTLIGSTHVRTNLVLNADGFSGLWRDQVPTATADLFPYVILTRDVQKTTPFDFQNPAGWNVFAAGHTYDAPIDFHLDAGDSVSVRLYLTVDYGQSAIRSTRQTPQYTLPLFAGKAPWRVQVTETANSLVAGDSTSSANYDLDVWDWGNGAGIGTDVTDADVAIPGIGYSTHIGSFSGGANVDPLHASFIATNVSAAAEGSYWGLVTVHDQATSGSKIADDLTTILPVTDYSTYQVFPVTVAPVTSGSNPPVAGIASPCTGLTFTANRPVIFDGSASIDDVTPPASLTYEWDFDYMAPTFTVDATGMIVTHSFASAGSFIVALRVTDGDAQTNIATMPVTIAAEGWRNVRKISTTAPVDDPLGGQYAEFGRRVFIDTNHQAHVFVGPSNFVFPPTPPDNPALILHLGGGCTGAAPSGTPLIGHHLPAVAQQGDILHLLRISDDTLSLIYERFNLSTNLIEATETVMPYSAVDATSEARAIAIDPANGNLFALGLDGSKNLYSSERTPTGSWTTPLLIEHENAVGTGNWMGAAVSNGKCMLLFRDSVNPGGGSPYRVYSTMKAFGGATWPARAAIGVPDGNHLSFELYNGPGNDLVGCFQSGTTTGPFYVHWVDSSQTWSWARVAQLGINEFAPELAIDSSGMVTYVWEMFVPGHRLLLQKRFAYDAASSAIGDPSYDIMQEDVNYSQQIVNIAVDPITGGLVAAWEKQSAPASFNYDVWSGEN